MTISASSRAEKARRPSMGVLHLPQGETKFRLARHAPSEDTAFFVKHYWIVSWDLTGEEPYLQHVVPNPCVNLVVERDRTGIFGPAKRISRHLLMGKGCVFGVKFRPGGFYPFIKRPLSRLAGRALDIADVFGVEPRSVERAILSLGDESAMVALAENIIRSRLPERDGTVALINAIIDRVAEDRTIVKVEDICRCFGINIRKLQRMFGQYVGVNPKWVIRLYRIHDAVDAMDDGRPVDLTQLSMELGYYDQPHFIKDFKAIVGKTPEEYVRRAEPESAS